MAHVIKENTRKKEILQKSNILDQITTDIEMLRKQCIWEIGERLEMAKHFISLSNRNDFPEWLYKATGNSTLGFKALGLYNTYKKLESYDAHETFLEMPIESIYLYVLSPGDIEEKANALDHLKGKSRVETIRTIRKMFPAENQHIPNNLNIISILLKQLKNLIFSIESRDINISDNDKKDILLLCHHLKRISE